MRRVGAEGVDDLVAGRGVAQCHGDVAQPALVADTTYGAAGSTIEKLPFLARKGES